ncbi:MAG: class I SAM-dependent methyltransferase [Patescibacteria group bacterium]
MIHTTRELVLYASRYMRGRVLDAGGGPAIKYKSLILQRAESYTCLDAHAGGGVDVVGDVLAMPFDDVSFDTVICNQVFEHVPHPDQLMSEISRVLRTGGHAIITAPFTQPVHADPGDFFRYTPEGLVAIAQRHGCKVIEKGAYGGFWALVSSYLKFLVFDPYKKQSRIKRAAARRLDNVLLWLDQWSTPKRVFSDSFVIIQKL